MKKLIFPILIGLAFIANSTQSQIVSNTVALASNAVQSAQLTLNKVSTNETINTAIISILSGVKSSGSEIYGASKQAIINSIDFVKVQAPDVVEQFLKWKMLEAGIYSFGAILLIFVWILVLWSAYKLMKKYDVFEACPVLMLTFFFLVPILSGLSYIMTIAQIWIAPKVYLIEYIYNITHK